MWLKPFKNIIAKPLDKSNGNGIAPHKHLRSFLALCPLLTSGL